MAKKNHEEIVQYLEAFGIEPQRTRIACYRLYQYLSAAAVGGADNEHFKTRLAMVKGMLKKWMGKSVRYRFADYGVGTVVCLYPTRGHWYAYVEWGTPALRQHKLSAIVLIE